MSSPSASMCTRLRWGSGSVFKGVISTYLRIEVHLIVDEVKHLFDPAVVDKQYVIWGDLDTL